MAIAATLEAQGIPMAVGTVPGVISGLARGGWIAVAIFGHHWRQVLIRKGKAAGAVTQPSPGGRKPWRVVGDWTSD